MDDERLKDPAWDYFDALLERIRAIRASEAWFYQKVRDILALSEDYDARSPMVNTFYAKRRLPRGARGRECVSYWSWPGFRPRRPDDPDPDPAGFRTRRVGASRRWGILGGAAVRRHARSFFARQAVADQETLDRAVAEDMAALAQCMA